MRWDEPNVPPIGDFSTGLPLRVMRAVVVGDDDHMAIRVALQPGEKFVAVVVDFVVAVVRIEPGDAIDVVGDGVAAVEVAEEEGTAAGVGNQRDMKFFSALARNCLA
jgi:hypothetical protein